MERAERNLAFWKGLVGLDASFPALAPLRDQDILSLMVVDEVQLGDMHSSLASNQLTQIVVEPGWGTTTLFRYMVREASDRVMERLLLPIAIDLEALFLSEGITSDGLEVEVKRQIIGLLVDNPWESALNSDYYFECINYDSSMELAAHKAQMLHFLSNRNPKASSLFSRFPWLNAPLDAQLRYLLANLRIQTALYIHFPGEVEAQRIRDLVFALKTTMDRAPLDYAAWREVYFCNPRQRLEIGRDFERPFSVLRYPRYTAAQIYLMLVKRYHPRVPGFRSQRQLGLSDVFAEAYVNEAWRQATSLRDVEAKMREAMLRRLDCPEESVPFRLQPLERVEVGGPEPPDHAAVGLARRRFERRRGRG